MSSYRDSWVSVRLGKVTKVLLLGLLGSILFCRGCETPGWTFYRRQTSADNPPEFATALRQDPTFQRLQDPTEQGTYAEAQLRKWYRQREDAHKWAFSLNDHLLSLLFLVQSDLNEHQRERLVSTLTNQGYRIETYTYSIVRQTLFEHFATTKTGLQDPNLRHSSHK